MSDMKTIILGHSHVWSLNRAIAGGAYQPAVPEFSTEVALCGTVDFPGALITQELVNGKTVLNPCVIAALSKQERVPETQLVSVVQLSLIHI